jgi:uncharacterized protein YcbK (DUF882 family)
MRLRKMVPLKNFHETEDFCRDGCGKQTHPELMLRLQAFLFIIERIYNAPVRCHLTGPARCDKRNAEVYGGKEVESYHRGMSRGKIKGEPGAAVDVIVEVYLQNSWARISKAKLAELAIESKLFGGVGWRIYGPAASFLHLDLGPVRTF